MKQTNGTNAERHTLLKKLEGTNKERKKRKIFLIISVSDST